MTTINITESFTPLKSIHHYTTVPFELFTIDDLFSEDELMKLTDLVSAASQWLIRRPFTYSSNFINGKLTHPVISQQIYTKLRPYLPSNYRDRKNQEWEFVGPIDILMYATIYPGQSFSIHTDTGYEYDSIQDHYSKYTALLYLNDSYVGGTTTFYDDDFTYMTRVVPKRGRLLCFDIDLFHSGDSVTDGIKQWIGTEWICHRVS